MWSNQLNEARDNSRPPLSETQRRSVETDLLLCLSSSSRYQETAVHGGTLDTSELSHFNHYFTPLKSPRRTCCSAERIKSWSPTTFCFPNTICSAHLPLSNLTIFTFILLSVFLSLFPGHFLLLAHLLSLRSPVFSISCHSPRVALHLLSCSSSAMRGLLSG